MLPSERKKQILSLLEQRKFIATKDLCRQLFVSHATIRRDLVELEAERFVIRTRGGAILTQKATNEETHSIREREKLEEKKAIADMASTFIEDGFALFFDASTTVNAIVPFLIPFKNLTIITNGVKTALDLSHYPDIHTIQVGGSLYPGSSSTVGTLAGDTISRYRVDLCLVSCRGINEEGAFEANEPQAVVKQKMMEHARKTVLLCDSGKFNNHYFYKLADFDAFDYVITDQKPKQHLLEKIEVTGAVLLEG